MGTTSAVAAAGVLDGLCALSVPFVVLHRESDIAAGNIPSDVDIALDLPESSVRRIVREAATLAGLDILMIWPPVDDVDATSFIISDEDAGAGVHLDVAHGRRGLGGYGVRCGIAVDRAVAGVRWPTLDAYDEWTYVVRKRQRKGDARAVERLMSIQPASPVGREALLRDESRSALRAWKRAARLTTRIRKPVGIWVHSTSPSLGAELADRFERLLPAGALVLPSSWCPARIDAFAMRIKPALVLTVGPKDVRALKPDVVVDEIESDVAIRRTVSALRRRHHR